MKLNKRYSRSIKANMPFYISATILNMVGLLIFYLFYIAGTGINRYGDEFFAAHNVEDAVFTTFEEITDDEIDELESRYSLTLEKEHFVNVTSGDIRIRVFRPAEKINTYEVISGSDISSDDEILISAGYAEQNDVKTGDTFTINGKEYAVCGTFLRPDYLYMLESISDDYKNVSTFFLAYMSPEEFERQFGKGVISYKAVYSDDTDITAFRKSVNEDHYVSGYTGADNNPRITFVHEQADMFLLGAWIMLVVLPFITVVLISIVIGRKIRSEQKIIGTLSAMGYERGKLMRHYSFIALIPGILGGILLTVTSMFLAQPYGERCLADYEPMQAKFTLPVWVALAGIVVPTLIFWLCAMLKVRNLLKKDTVQLLGGQVGNDGRNRRIMARSKARVKTKYAIRTLVGNPGRSIVIFLGIFLGAMIVAFAFSFFDSVNAVGDQAHDEFGSFKNEYVLNELRSGTPEDGEPVMALQFEDESQTSFTVMGMDEDTTLWNLETVDGERADLRNGIYISTLTEAIFKVHKGDEFTFRSIASLEEYTVKVDGVIKNGYQGYLISSRENIADITGIDPEYYNAILSDRDLDIDSDAVSQVISDTTYKNQMENMLTSMGGIIWALVAVGVIVCVTSLFVTVNMMISESSHNISMLKVLGQDNRRINSMMINSSHILLIPGIILGMLTAWGVMAWYAAAFVKVERIMIPATLYPKSMLATAAITAASYFFALFLVRRKVDKVDMVEALKDNRE